MENKVQVEKLKLNVTNIKSTLISSNKRLRKVEIKKDELVLKLTKDQTRRKAEGSVEEKNIKGAGIFGRVIGRIAAPVMNLWDRVLNFFGAILLGFILTKLPKIIKTLEPVLKVAKPIFIGTLKAIGFITEKMIDFVGFLSDFQESFNPSESQKNLKESEKRLNEIVGDKLESTDSNRNERISRSEEIDSKLFGENVESSQAKISTPSPNPSLTGEIQKRNMGGVVNKPQDANLPPQSSSFGNVDNKNPFKRFYAASNKNLKNAVLLSTVSENFGKLFKSNTLKRLIAPTGDSPTSTPTPTSTATSTSTLTGSTAFVSQRNDPDAEQTGSDIVMGDGSVGANIPNPFKSLTITGTGFQGNGSGINGSGYGNYVTGETIIDGKKYELLIGHLDAINVKRGDILSGGQSLGTQGITGRATGPHVTTHINEKDGGNPHTILRSVEDAWVNGKIINSFDPYDHFRNNKGGGISRLLNSRNLSGGQSDTDMTIAILPMYQRVDNYVNSNTPQMSGGSSSGIGNLIAFTGKRVNLQTFRLG